MQIRCDALIVDPDLETRMRLRQATSQVHDFEHIQMANSYQEGIRALSSDENCDVLLVRYSLAKKEMADFVKRAKETEQGKGCALVLVLSARKQDADTIAASMVEGADGFLCEPYSVDALNQIVEIAQKVKLKKLEERKRAAVRMMIEKGSQLLDVVAFRHFRGQPANPEEYELRKLKQSLEPLFENDKKAYEDALISVFESIDKPAYKRGNYSGASERVRKKLEQQAKEEAEGVQADQNANKAAPAKAGQRIIRKR